MVHPLIAIDEKWNKYSLADSKTRIELGQLLKRK